MIMNEAFRKQCFLKGIGSFPLTRWKIYLLDKNPDQKLFRRLPAKREKFVVASFDMVLDIKTLTLSAKKPISFPRNNKKKLFTVRSALVTSRSGRYQLVMSAGMFRELAMTSPYIYPKSKTIIGMLRLEQGVL